MKKILNIKNAIEVTNKLNGQHKKIVLAGGCFDILHIGHITFLEKAKKRGDILMLLLESDESATRLKGENRPITSQADRARILASLQMVDYVINLPKQFSHKDYDGLVVLLKPAIIATTAGDVGLSHKKRQVKQIGAKVITVTKRLKYHSTSAVAQKIIEEFIL